MLEHSCTSQIKGCGTNFTRQNVVALELQNPCTNAPLKEVLHQARLCVFKPLYVLRLGCKDMVVYTPLLVVSWLGFVGFLTLKQSPLMHLCLYKITGNYAYLYFDIFFYYKSIPVQFIYKTKKNEKTSFYFYSSIQSLLLWGFFFFFPLSQRYGDWMVSITSWHIRGVYGVECSECRWSNHVAYLDDLILVNSLSFHYNKH